MIELLNGDENVCFLQQCGKKATKMLLFLLTSQIEKHLIRSRKRHVGMSIAHVVQTKPY
jgi:hypothetical protein